MEPDWHVFQQKGMYRWRNSEEIFPLNCIPEKRGREQTDSNIPMSTLWAQMNGWGVVPNGYEPYVILRAPPISPWCDERFSAYGKNKFSFITPLIYTGHWLYGLPRAFVSHVAHPKSPSRMSWESGQWVAVREQWNQFLLELQLEYATPRTSPGSCNFEMNATM